MGHILILDDSEAEIALTGYSQKLWNQRADELPAGADRLGCGTLWVAADDDEMDEVQRKWSFYTSRGIRSEVLDAPGLYHAEPNLRPGLKGGLRVPGDSVVYPPPVAAHMLRTVQSHGGTILLRRGVISMTGRCVRLDDGTNLECDYAINATGAAAASLTQGCEVRKRKGHLVITDRYPGFIKHQLIELGYVKSAHAATGSSVAFNTQPRSTGQLLIGSSRQFGEESTDVDYAILSRMLDRAIHYLPGIASLMAVRVWTGFRAATPDKLPLIGPHPQDPHLLLATGHEGVGITTSLATARLIADYLSGRTPAISPGPYLPARIFNGVAHVH
jgi:glycine/D-amino acid oxidase-like deaminating enzyme